MIVIDARTGLRVWPLQEAAGAIDYTILAVDDRLFSARALIRTRPGAVEAWVPMPVRWFTRWGLRTAVFPS